jgi:(E)-4-hydroxy-3-methylbut-2-enyl-diphosphate synthase
MPYYRRKTQEVQIGNLALGGDNPIRVQSMTNTATSDIEKTVAQCIRMIDAGCEYVRITVPAINDAENLKNIKDSLRKKGYQTPLIADVHFNPKVAEIAAELVEKVRINPGNYADKKQFRQSDYSDKEYVLEIERISERLLPLLKICQRNGTAIRIGTNHGSLSDRIISQYGNTPLGMAMSAMEYVQICNSFGFHKLVLSMKSSDTQIMVQSVRLLVKLLDEKQWHYPLHLGVTEAGNGEYGRIKSAIGIGTLLQDGIGDTIRVSLTESPENEITFAYDILQACGLRYHKAEIIACPSCGRTQYNIEAFLEEIKKRTSHLKGLKIAVMGCIVNGPGEMADADYGFIGSGNGKVSLYKRQTPKYQNIPEAEAVDKLIELIKENGDCR